MRFGLVCSGVWWKGIGAFNGGGTHLYQEIVEVQDAAGVTKYADFDQSKLELYDITLQKAKILGVHCDMYKIANAKEMQEGCAYTFKWISD